MELLLGFIFGFFAGLAGLGWLVRTAKANPAGMSSLVLARFGL